MADMLIEDIEDLWVDLDPASLPHDVHGIHNRKHVTVRALRRDRIEEVRDRTHACEQVDLILALELLGVASAVEVLMVLVDDPGDDLQIDLV